ncbi:hypothetical protein BJ912DRAFT_275409 [Pholiota molesta]|nr:hypothetical protein BJ912DRAFT_275409 [Pholiota molesta]
MFIPKFLVVLLALLLGSVIAAPAYYERSDEVELEARQRGLSRFRQAAQSVAINRQVKQKLRPKAGEAVFWSGSTPDAHGKPVSARVHAEQFAKTHPGTSTVNHALAKHGISIPDKPQNRYSDKMWGVASKVWAERAHGDTHVVLGGHVRPGSVYNTIEKPTLMNNHRVTKVTEHNVATGKSTVVKGHR